MAERACCLGVLLFLGLFGAAGDSVAVEPHAGMLRYPDVSATHIAFLYANDLWLVPREGGTAVPLASPPGEESFPRFSPDGSRIAFVGNYDGNSDLYTVPVSGGVPNRVTHHPAVEFLTDWTPDGRLIFFARGLLEYPRAQELFTVAAAGGLPRKLPVPYGANGRVSPDGKWLAYTPHSRDNRTWKRYRGGMATDIWLFHLEEHSSRQITDWEGTDSQPMWHGDEIYYLSDAGSEHRLNIWAYDTRSGQRRQVTTYEDYDVKWPADGPGPRGQGEIVYQLGNELHLLDLGTGSARPVQVVIPGARAQIRVKPVDVAELIFARNISPTGKRVVVGARGDVWTLPARKGSPRNLIRTSGSAERDPAWSPDGKSIAFFSDVSGSYELHVTEPGGLAAPRRLTDLQRGYLYSPTWSPDSRWICFWDETGLLFLHDVQTEQTRQVDRAPGGGQSSVSWSADSAWMAYARAESLVRPNALWLYDVKNETTHRVTHGMFNDSWPTFDREGKYLYFASQREISSPRYEDLGTTWIYAHTDRLYVVPLSVETPSPMAPESDEEGEGDEEQGENGKDGADREPDKKKKKKGKDESADDEGEKKPDPVKIDLDGFESRVVALPVERGNFGMLGVNNENRLIYSRFPARGEDAEPSIHVLDLDADKDEDREKTVLEGVGRFAMSADGKKLLVLDDGQMAIVDAAAEQKMEHQVSAAGMTAHIDPRKEWRQLFHEAWRIQRDFFYDPNLHGVDWEGVRRQYEPMLADCTSREDVSYVIREMISELNVGHAYYGGGDIEDTPNVSVGMLGCAFELHDGAYRIAHIYEGAHWDVDARGPLSQPGVKVEPGDYLLAVNGVPVDTAKDPWAAFQGLAGRTVTLTVGDKPEIDDTARPVVVELLDSESSLVYRSWVEKNRAYVSGKTEGRVGYIYVPNTGIFGQNEMMRQFVGQLHLDALIIDERWNGGGQIPTRFVELLNRPIANYWAIRDPDDFPWPPDAHHGPKCMLINGLAGSGGDYLPYWFRKAGLGKLIGTRTWGGLVGISGNPRLIDGGMVTAPTFAFFETDGTWGIEGHGVDPDIEVRDDPAQMFGGKDPQLDAAIEHMLAEIRRNPYSPPARPDYPDRSGMGIPNRDR